MTQLNEFLGVSTHKVRVIYTDREGNKQDHYVNANGLNPTHAAENAKKFIQNNYGVHPSKVNAFAVKDATDPTDLYPGSAAVRQTWGNSTGAEAPKGKGKSSGPSEPTVGRGKLVITHGYGPNGEYTGKTYTDEHGTTGEVVIREHSTILNAILDGNMTILEQTFEDIISEKADLFLGRHLNQIAETFGESASELSPEAHELVLHIDNEQALHNKHNAVANTIRKHYNRGNYDHDKATHAFNQYVAIPAAKDYGRQHSVNDGLSIFSPAVRMEVARHLADRHLSDMQDGISESFAMGDDDFQVPEDDDEFGDDIAEQTESKKKSKGTKKVTDEKKTEGKSKHADAVDKFRKHFQMDETYMLSTSWSNAPSPYSPSQGAIVRTNQALRNKFRAGRVAGDAASEFLNDPEYFDALRGDTPNGQ